MKSKTCFVWFAYLVYAIVPLQVLSQSLQEGNTYTSHTIERTEKTYDDEEAENSGRSLREHPSRRTSSYADIMNNIWHAAVSGNSGTTSSSYQKCRLPDGTIVVIGDHYGKGKSNKSSKSSRSSKSSKSCRSSKSKGKGSRCSHPISHPTYVYKGSSTDSNSLPSSKSSECYGKGKSCKNSKKKKSKKSSDKSKLSKSSKKSKSSKSKSSKGRYEDADLPYCSDLTIAPTDSGNANTPAPTKSQDANNNVTVAPTIASTIAPTIAPTSAPTTAEEFARCNSIRNATGNPSGNPSQTFKLFVAVESANELDDNFSDRLNTAMRGILALATGCRDAKFTSGRRLQNAPDAVDLGDFTEIDLGGGTCEAVFDITISSEVCTAFESLVQTFGGEVFGDIEQLCQEYGPQLANALDVDKIQCVVDMFPFDIVVPTSSPSFRPTSLPTSSPTATPTSSPTSPPTDATITTGRGESIETGGWIAIAAGGLILFSLCLCFLCSRRAREAKERDAPVPYTKTFDESSLGTNENAGNSGDVASSRRPIFVNPEMSPEIENYESDNYAPTDVAPTDEEEEYPIKHKSAANGLYFDAVEQPSSNSPAEEMMLHEKGEVCSSPTCRMCEGRRQEGTVAHTMPSWLRKKEYPPRGYIQDDTVEL